MALVGLWHGAGWGYVAWGLYHGTLLNLNAWWKRSGRGLPPWLGRPLFLVGILMGWALFMSPSWHFLRDLVGGMAGYQGPGSLAVIRRLWEDNATLALLPAIPLAFSGRAEASALLDAGRAPARWQFVGWGVLAGVALLLIQREISFFYVQF
jgi:alginate O-acetyltransferase complex protein AlgI